MSENKNIKCLCEDAVRNTYLNLIQQNCSKSDALQSAFKVLKYHHPEILEKDIPDKVVSILIQKSTYI
tara:strand:+ start:301 stop:504 length:204 start_codon:yes stop_codon:yes gene_type:complete